MEEGTPVWLAGQFDGPEGKAVLLTETTHFSTPVQKTHGPEEREILREDAHLTWYRLEQTLEEPRRTVFFENQFDTGQITIKEPKFLLVPTAKKTQLDEEVPIPEGIDHYKCYEIVDRYGSGSGQTVNLKDQFGLEKRIGTGRSIGVLWVFS